MSGYLQSEKIKQVENCCKHCVKPKYLIEKSIIQAHVVILAILRIC